VISLLPSPPKVYGGTPVIPEKKGEKGSPQIKRGKKRKFLKVKPYLSSYPKVKNP